MPKIYRIGRKHFDDYFELHVSKTAKEMKRHIKDWADKCDAKVFDVDEQYEGLVQPTYMREFPAENDRRWYCSMFATMFLNAEYITHEVVAHECLHVAMAHERCVEHFMMDYGGDCGDHEERLAYYLGEITQEVIKTLKEGKYLR
jgi:hypothetical protein